MAPSTHEHQRPQVRREGETNIQEKAAVSSTHPASTHLTISSERLVKTDRAHYSSPSQGLGEPAIVAMHGFPEQPSTHLCPARLIPPTPRPSPPLSFLLQGARSGPGLAGQIKLAPLPLPRPWAPRPASPSTRARARLVLVAHGASGPDAIDYALDAPERISQLILLDTCCTATHHVAPPKACDPPIRRRPTRATRRRDDAGREPTALAPPIHRISLRW